MGRMKPAALLQHSKKKKGPAKLSPVTVVGVGAIVILLLLSVLVLHRHKSGGNIDGREDVVNAVSIVEDKVSDGDGEKSDLKESAEETHFPRYALVHNILAELPEHPWNSMKTEPREGIQFLFVHNLVLGLCFQRRTFNTTKGFFTVELFGKQTPLTVENFVTHSEKGYYNGVTFHRIIKDFIIQSGDPGGDGRGGESIWGGSFKDEFKEELVHEAFTLSMANIGEPNSNRSQFFITTIATPHLNMKHTVFGRVVRGQEVVQAIERVETDQDERPLTPVYINSINVHEEL